jgi:hypothetical protein
MPLWGITSPHGLCGCLTSLPDRRWPCGVEVALYTDPSAGISAE